MTMAEIKREYIKRLERFCIESNACQRVNLYGLDYARFRGCEWLYVFVGENGTHEKRINITGDSNEEITRSFFNGLYEWEHLDYLTPGYCFSDLGGRKNE